MSSFNSFLLHCLTHHQCLLLLPLLLCFLLLDSPVLFEILCLAKVVVVCAFYKAFIEPVLDVIEVKHGGLR